MRPYRVDGVGVRLVVDQDFEHRQVALRGAREVAGREVRRAVRVCGLAAGGGWRPGSAAPKTPGGRVFAGCRPPTPADAIRWQPQGPGRPPACTRGATRCCHRHPPHSRRRCLRPRTLRSAPSLCPSRCDVPRESAPLFVHPPCQLRPRQNLSLLPSWFERCSHEIARATCRSASRKIIASYYGKSRRDVHRDLGWPLITGAPWASYFDMGAMRHVLARRPHPAAA